MTKIPVNQHVANSVLDYFPLDKPRGSQVQVIQAIERAYQNGARFVILEAPVGSGKSAIAITFARRYGDSHILTPKKSLQDQYFEDFEQHICLMKGRSAYPCVYFDDEFYEQIRKMIARGDTPHPNTTGVSTAEGPCRDGNKEVWERCNARHTCPYTLALEQAMADKHVVHNVHSFIFQAYMNKRFDKRGILIIDECHNLEGIVRDFLTRSITLEGIGYEVPKFKTIEEYEPFIRNPERRPKRMKQEESEQFDKRIDALLDALKGKEFVIDVKRNDWVKMTNVKFIPKSIGSAANNYMFEFGQKVLLMSGTIYDKASFCRSVGISIEETAFIRVPSTFPIRNRPIYMKKEYMTDNSHKEWAQSFSTMVKNIQKVMDKLPEQKGLIHAPSYVAMEEIYNALDEEHKARVVIHGRDDFKVKIEEFYEDKNPKVFMSPICQEGVDFKGDRARFQMILRVPFPNAGDPLTSVLMKEDYPWYNRQALIVFGQQIGRINRSEDDHGVTILMDYRFLAFIHRNQKLLPQWLLDAIKTE